MLRTAKPNVKLMESVSVGSCVKPGVLLDVNCVHGKRKVFQGQTG